MKNLLCMYGGDVSTRLEGCDFEKNFSIAANKSLEGEYGNFDEFLNSLCYNVNKGKLDKDELKINIAWVFRKIKPMNGWYSSAIKKKSLGADRIKIYKNKMKHATETLSLLKGFDLYLITLKKESLKNARKRSHK